MRIHLEQLPHQEAAIAAILQAFEGQLEESATEKSFNSIFANPRLKAMRGIDVKMETGTGKTYVYTRLMHELYRKYRLFKFIIMTPSLPIKEGTKNFISSEYATQHFRELFPEQKISLGVVNSGDFSTKKGNRKQFAPSLSDFAEADTNSVGNVNVLLVNDAMLASKSMTRDDYDQTLIGGSTQPIEALRLTRPIVIIDEPHRFRKDGRAWKYIQQLNPQLIIRFGATFPEITTGRGQLKTTQTDYDNLVYNLTAVESFNQGLVKAVDVMYPNLSEDLAKLRYQVKKATAKTLTLRRSGIEHEINVGEQLSNVDPLFEGGVTYEGKLLSNELPVAEGMWLVPGVWTNAYQQVMLSQAIDAHFEKEIELFHRPGNAPKVKVLSLFFIDHIGSYRDKEGWLKSQFEQLLSQKIETLLVTAHGEYRDYLEATRASLQLDNQQVHAGYFAEDSTKKSDEAIQEQVDDILRNKEQLLQFKDEFGRWNTRRFLFSKWTLREGWDNPNVFVLTKLRSSGSETSKIQEVGRGLRLPVDELGNRLSAEEFRLTFLIDFSERDFANKLIAEINLDGGGLQAGKITDSVLDQIVALGHASDANQAMVLLLSKQIIDYQRNVLDVQALHSLIPLGVQEGKVRGPGEPKAKVHLRSQNWEKIRSLWDEASRRFMVEYQRLSDAELADLATASITREEFVPNSGTVRILGTRYNQITGTVELTERSQQITAPVRQLKYGEFVKRLNRTTNLSVNLLHQSTVNALQAVDLPDELFNEITLQNIKRRFRLEFITRYSKRYEYNRLGFRAYLNVYADDGHFKKEMAQGLVGTKMANDVQIPENYLYDEAVYDSEIEHSVLKQNMQPEVLVFGKLPRQSLRLPTYLGTTTTPDFVYAIRNVDGNAARLYALIETKDKKTEDYYIEEQVALEAQSVLRSQIERVEIRLINEAEDVHAIIESLADLSH